MGVDCYRIAGYRELPDGRLEVTTHSLAPRNTNVEELLRMAAPDVRRATEPVGDLRGGHAARYRIAPRERRDALALLKSHCEPVVTAIDTGCDISVCLDFYQHPIEGDPTAQWEPTAIGDLVHDAKYRPGWPGSRTAAPECRARIVSCIESHPVLRRLTGVAAMPGSGIGITSRVPGVAARGVAKALNVPLVELRRTGKARPQKNLPAGTDPDANQRGTMSASIVSDPGLIVVVDDLMAQGSTVREANRALREAGALRVASVTLVKDRTGTRRFAFPRGLE